MDLTLIRLSAPPQPRTPHREPTSPDIVADILWATAIPDDRLEHIRTRYGPVAGVVDLAVFHRPGGRPAADLALQLCHRAIGIAPVLAGWTARILADPADPTDPTDRPTDQWRPLCT